MMLLAYVLMLPILKQKYPVLDAEKAEEARLKKNMSAEKANAYAETLQLLSELQKVIIITKKVKSNKFINT